MQVLAPEFLSSVALGRKAPVTSFHGERGYLFLGDRHSGASTGGSHVTSREVVRSFQAGGRLNCTEGKSRKSD